MGVRGLSTFIAQNEHFSKPFRLHDTVVILDGNNVMHDLYSHCDINYTYGGDYKKFADAVRRYLSVFLDCNVKPILVFDGGQEKSDIKLRTTIKRFKQRLFQVWSYAQNGEDSGLVLPIITSTLFRSVLSDMNIPFAQSEFEADNEIAALANVYNCAVISADSDFYIFDVRNGFINLNGIEKKVNTGFTANGKEYKYLNCKIYNVNRFVSFFPGLDKSALPLFGTLMGNDFVEKESFEHFCSLLKVQNCDDEGSSFVARKINGILHWLQTTKLKLALEQVKCYLKNENVPVEIEKSIEAYELHNCNSSFVISKNFTALKRELLCTSELRSPCGTILPIDLVLLFHQGHLPSFFIDAVVLHRVILGAQIENNLFPNSFNCSLSIRQVLYGILTRHDICENQACLSPIEEFTRQRNKFCIESVPSPYKLDDYGELPKINEITDLPSEVCKEILCKALGINTDFLLNVPSKWQLFLACTNFWLCNSVSNPSKIFIYAAVLNLIYYSLVLSKNLFIQKECCENASMHDKCSCSKISCSLSYIDESNLRPLWRKLKNFTYDRPIEHEKPLIDIIHCYSELQACLLFTIYLNKLLGTCYENPSPDICISGTLLYNLAKEMISNGDPDSFVADILGKNSDLHTLFANLNSKVCENLPDSCSFKRRSRLQQISKDTLDEIKLILQRGLKF